MLYTLHPRQAVITNVDKMINCGDPSFGGAMYACSKCGMLKFVPFRCKSRFCPTCGVKYCQERSNAMFFKLIQCTHRHCVFTIDEELRHFFLEDRSLLDCLFHAVRSVVLRLFHEMNKSKNFVPGFICVLHTFGRPLEWNPHIHCLITEGGFSDDGFWRVVKHFNYSFLRKSFQTALLNEMEKHIGSSFKKTKAAIYKKDKNGFYVYAKPNLCDDYINIFSVVFQDFQLISQPLGNNVAGSMNYDRERVRKALLDAGFGDRLATMEKGLDTTLYKGVYEDGVDVSGGEAQKIAIARALYKDAPFIILDEPTAALDPIAEAEIYSKFDEIAGDKTAIYISHRLSSCKFCDEIAVFHEGAVIQQGTHAELVADENGKYYELWNAQAQYYTE